MAVAAHSVAAVRTELQRYIVHKYDRGAGGLSVHLLDEGLEREVQALWAAERGPAESAENNLETRRERIRSVVRAAVGPAGPNSPVILTTATIRPYLRGVMADERPDLAVLAYEELPPDVHVKELGRIARTDLDAARRHALPQQVVV